MERLTVKGCVPFLDTLTSGYALKLPQDIACAMEHFDNDGNPLMHVKYSLQTDLAAKDGTNLNFGDQESTHPVFQLGDSPMVAKNNGRPFHKILNPWRIKTPPGYSCLFLPPMNNWHEPWSIIPGIVDTDKFQAEVNFPTVVDTEKIKTKFKRFLMKKGTPYVQVIPYKKESWEMKVKEIKTAKKSTFLYPMKLLHNYKTSFWKKITWK
tara:strand:- start:8771 stop:9397 length:627 start_codon:yes stop_codon:yes gene_type:complete